VAAGSGAWQRLPAVRKAEILAGPVMSGLYEARNDKYFDIVVFFSVGLCPLRKATQTHSLCTVLYPLGTGDATSMCEMLNGWPD
jgi:hypothetical protein